MLGLTQKWEVKRRALKMHVCVGWCVKWNSLWHYTALPSYNFIEWMISMIVTVCLWCHSNIVQIRPDLARLNSVQTLAIIDMRLGVWPLPKVGRVHLSNSLKVLAKVAYSCGESKVSLVRWFQAWNRHLRQTSSRTQRWHQDFCQDVC